MSRGPTASPSASLAAVFVGEGQGAPAVKLYSLVSAFLLHAGVLFGAGLFFSFASPEGDAAKESAFVSLRFEEATERPWTFSPPRLNRQAQRRQSQPPPPPVLRPVFQTVPEIKTLLPRAPRVEPAPETTRREPLLSTRPWNTRRAPDEPTMRRPVSRERPVERPLTSVLELSVSPERSASLTPRVPSAHPAGRRGDLRSRPPKIISYPKYCPLSVYRGGRLVVEVKILPDGSVGEVRLVGRVTDERLRKAARWTAKRMRFLPALDAGRPVTRIERIPVRIKPN